MCNSIKAKKPQESYNFLAVRIASNRLQLERMEKILKNYEFLEESLLESEKMPKGMVSGVGGSEFDYSTNFLTSSFNEARIKSGLTFDDIFRGMLEEC